MCRDGVLYLVSKAGTTPDPTAATTSIAALNGQLDEPMPDFDAIELNTDDATVLSIQVDHTLSSSDITLFDACFRQCCYDLTLYLPAFQDITIVGPFQEESNPYTWSVEVPNVASTEVANEFDQQLDLWREGSPAMLTGPARPPASTPTARTRARRRSTAVKPEPKPAVDETPSAAVQSE